MAEYIKRKEAIAVACKGCNKEFPNEPCEPSECHIQQGLFNIPAADVVPVVRCKDCVHSYDGMTGLVCGRCGKRINGIRVGGVSVKNEHFCSYGERREGE